MPKIETMYAYVAVEKEPDDEGVVAVKMGDVWMPLVGADIARITSLRTLAEGVARFTKKKIVLVKFTNRTEVETLSAGNP